MKLRNIAACLMASASLVGSATGWAQGQSAGITITREVGSSVKTDLGYNVVLNDKSSLNREQMTLHDASLPLDIEGTTCPTTIYESERSRGDYRYTATYQLVAKEPVSAFQVKFLVFDAFGAHIRTLVTTELADLAANAPQMLSAKWNIYSENEASEYFACLSYVSKVRTASGRVYEASNAAVLAEARKFSKRLTEEDIEPKREKK